MAVAEWTAATKHAVTGSVAHKTAVDIQHGAAISLCSSVTDLLLQLTWSQGVALPFGPKHCREEASM